MKKCLPIIFAALLTVSALTGCAGQNASSEQNNAAVQNKNSGPAISQPATPINEASSPAIEVNSNIPQIY